MELEWIAKKDPLIDLMYIQPVPEIKFCDFLRTIPKKIHQCWFWNQGKLPETRSKEWQMYGKTHGYEYICWNEKDYKSELELLMGENLFQIFSDFLNQKQFELAKDILRYYILNSLGGIFIDFHLHPPCKDGKTWDFAWFLPLKGFVMTTDWHSRNVENFALYGNLSFLMSTPHYPLLDRVCASLYPNIKKILADKQHQTNRLILTGPHFFNKCLCGVFTIISPSIFYEFMKCD